MIFTFDRQRNKDNPYFTVSGGTWEYFNSMSMPELIKDIVKVDDYTVKFELTRPEAPMIADLAMDFRLHRVEGICRRDDEGRHGPRR